MFDPGSIIWPWHLG